MDIKKNWFYWFFATIFTILISINISYSYNFISSAQEGLIFIPMPDVAGSTLISYNPQSSYYKWITIINEFLHEYEKTTKGMENLVSCSFKSWPLGEKQVCDVNMDEFYPCTSANLYNYMEGGPCVFLKINNNLNWKPEPYNNSTNLPEAMPEDLKMYIQMVTGKPEADTVWVTCKGVNPADEENIGPIQYIPRRGFPSYYYPFTNKQGYLSPLVAVLFENPRKGVKINIECRAWAKNIYGRLQGRESAQFELMVEKNE